MSPKKLHGKYWCNFERLFISYGEEALNDDELQQLLFLYVQIFCVNQSSLHLSKYSEYHDEYSKETIKLGILFYNEI